jgi:hypothetical protein
VVNNGNADTSVTRHRSSSQIAKEEEVTGILADNQIILFLFIKELNWSVN